MGTPKFPVSKTAEGPKTPSEDPPTTLTPRWESAPSAGSSSIVL